MAVVIGTSVRIWFYMTDGIDVCQRYHPQPNQCAQKGGMESSRMTAQGLCAATTNKLDAAPITGLENQSRDVCYLYPGATSEAKAAPPCERRLITLIW
jgi:hypothetical protein